MLFDLKAYTWKTLVQKRLFSVFLFFMAKMIIKPKLWPHFGTAAFETFACIWTFMFSLKSRIFGKTCATNCRTQWTAMVSAYKSM